MRAGNFGLPHLLASVAKVVVQRVRRRLFGVRPHGDAKRTPTESLNLQPGEWVEVKPLDSIARTLDAQGNNRGLYFSPDMGRWCGRKVRVRARLEKLIADGAGEMMTFHNTVALEGSTCGCANVALGMNACARCELSYWREIWLRRCSPPTT